MPRSQVSRLGEPITGYHLYLARQFRARARMAVPAPLVRTPWVP